jgi:hypothetical protein
MKKGKNYSLGLISFLQAFALTIYCSLIAVLFWRGNKWFGKVPNYLGPLLFLILFSTSALICALLTLGYPAFLLWQKKKTDQAIKLVIYTTGWLFLFVILLMAFILLTK